MISSTLSLFDGRYAIYKAVKELPVMITRNGAAEITDLGAFDAATIDGPWLFDTDVTGYVQL